MSKVLTDSLYIIVPRPIYLSRHDYDVGQGSVNCLSRGKTNEMISLGGPQLLSKEKHSARFNIVSL